MVEINKIHNIDNREILKDIPDKSMIRLNEVKNNLFDGLRNNNDKN